MFTEFLNMYATEILHALALAFVGWLGVVAKGLAARYINTDVKRSVAKTAVMAVEQLYKDIHGPEKMHKALLIASDLLDQQGIAVTVDEMKTLLEAAVGEFNANFYPEKKYEKTPLYEGPQQGSMAEGEFEEALGDLSFGPE